MQYLTAMTSLQHKVNSLVYSRPGAGKTTFGLQHPFPVIVDPGEQGYLTIVEGWDDVPVLRINGEDDMEDIIFEPDNVMTEWKKHNPEFRDYPYKSFIFENFNLIQEEVLGKASKVEPVTKKVIREATGIMKLPNTRDNRETPGMKDFNVLQRKTKDLFKGIRNMPYHTLMTVHAGIFDTDESPKGLNVPDTDRIKAGYPNMYGQLKWTGGGLADFYFYLERQVTGGKLRYYAHSRPYKKFEGRSKMAKQLEAKIDWTDKSLFDHVMNKLSTALDKAKAKGK